MSEIRFEHFGMHVNHKEVLQDINFTFEGPGILALLGPPDSGKSDLLRAINKYHPPAQALNIQGSLYIDGKNLYQPQSDFAELQRKVGVVYKNATLFPGSIYHNLAFGLKLAGKHHEKFLLERVERSLETVGLLQKFKDNLKDTQVQLTRTEIQLLCIARMLATDPQIIMLEEPLVELDTEAISVVEKILYEKRFSNTIIISTFNQRFAARLSTHCAPIMHGKLIEFEKTSLFFTNPSTEETANYITGRYNPTQP